MTARVLVVGIGGLGCPTLVTLAKEPRFTGSLVLADDDLVDETNLHRQVLYTPSDVGRDKLDAARDALLALGFPSSRIELVRARFLPDNALSLARGVDVVVEGADNFATKFLTADACHLAERPAVQGAAVRWNATVLASRPRGAPCYRCLFEDVPSQAPNCAEAGVVGPVLGVAGALMADAALRILAGDPAVFGRIHTVDGLKARVRSVTVPARANCPLCGTHSIQSLSEDRYLAPTCAA
jgi:adenylyltransferase/sulfurtransferase